MAEAGTPGRDHRTERETTPIGVVPLPCQPPGGASTHPKDDTKKLRESTGNPRPEILLSAHEWGAGAASVFAFHGTARRCLERRPGRRQPCMPVGVWGAGGTGGSGSPRALKEGAVHPHDPHTPRTDETHLGRSPPLWGPRGGCGGRVWESWGYIRGGHSAMMSTWKCSRKTISARQRTNDATPHDNARDVHRGIRRQGGSRAGDKSTMKARGMRSENSRNPIRAGLSRRSVGSVGSGSCAAQGRNRSVG
jgi:hypothetical protein